MPTTEFAQLAGVVNVAINTLSVRNAATARHRSALIASALISWDSEVSSTSLMVVGAFKTLAILRMVAADSMGPPERGLSATDTHLPNIPQDAANAMFANQGACPFNISRNNCWADTLIVIMFLATEGFDPLLRARGPMETAAGADVRKLEQLRADSIVFECIQEGVSSEDTRKQLQFVLIRIVHIMRAGGTSLTPWVELSKLINTLRSISARCVGRFGPAVGSAGFNDPDELFTFLMNVLGWSSWYTPLSVETSTVTQVRVGPNDETFALEVPFIRTLDVTPPDPLLRMRISEETHGIPRRISFQRALATVFDNVSRREEQEEGQNRRLRIVAHMDSHGMRREAEAIRRTADPTDDTAFFTQSSTFNFKIVNDVLIRIIDLPRAPGLVVLRQPGDFGLDGFSVDVDNRNFVIAGETYELFGVAVRSVDHYWGYFWIGESLYYYNDEVDGVSSATRYGPAHVTEHPTARQRTIQEQLDASNRPTLRKVESLEDRVPKRGTTTYREELENRGYLYFATRTQSA